MSNLTIGVPGAPALHPTTMANATASGALDMPGSKVGGTLSTPTKTFSVALQGGGTMTLYKGMPRRLSPALRTQLLARGLIT